MMTSSCHAPPSCHMQITKLSKGQLFGIVALIALVVITVFNVILYLESKKWQERKGRPMPVKMRQNFR